LLKSVITFNRRVFFMDRHIPEFYHPSFDDAPSGRFHEVLLLDKSSELSWNDVVELVPDFPRGWFELANLSSEDRIDFTCYYWLRKLPFHLKLNESLERFFASLDDIAVFLIQKRSDGPFQAEMVYSLSDNGGFYRGAFPASDANIQALKKAFPDILLPEDYIDFLQIHDGWCKTTDSTGLMSSLQIKDSYDQFQLPFVDGPILTTLKGVPVDPKKLIPFYKSFGMPYYQCFWADWYPEDEMGNVYYSSASNCISGTCNRENAAEMMSFPTFSEWLAFYLERVG
jgi:hypothetical protein